MAAGLAAGAGAGGGGSGGSRERVLFVVIGGLAYTLGGIVLITKRPDPFPRTFGFHEIWHVFVLVGAVVHLGVSASIV